MSLIAFPSEIFVTTAEGEGFEPSEPAWDSTVFKTVAFVRSAIPPRRTLPPHWPHRMRSEEVER